MNSTKHEEPKELTKEPEEKCRVLSWKTLYEIPKYLVLGFTDRGMFEIMEAETLKVLDSDNLRVAIEISTCDLVLNCGPYRIVLEEDFVKIEIPAVYSDDDEK